MLDDVWVTGLTKQHNIIYNTVTSRTLMFFIYTLDLIMWIEPSARKTVRIL